MTASIDVNNVGLQYRLGARPSLAQRRSASPLSGSRIETTGQRRVVNALNGVTFSLRSGDRLGLVGPNGAGKTTLLKMIYGIFRPTQGSIDVVGRADALFNINLGFRMEASGRRNIELRGLINGWTPREIDARMDDIIDFSELGEFIDVPFKTYSQGMAARLAFAVATSMNPEILLMDEWIGAGDPQFQQKANERMTRLSQDASIIVLASHNHDLIRRTCTKVMRLVGGRVDAFYDDIAQFTD